MNDYAAIPEPGTVEIRRMLPGPIERVWAWLTESEPRRKWLASGEMDLRAGGEVHLHWRRAASVLGYPWTAGSRVRTTVRCLGAR